MSAFLVEENDEIESGPNLNGLNLESLTFSKNLFEKCGRVYPEGYSEDSAEAIITNGVLLYPFLQHAYHGVPPSHYSSQYYELEQSLAEAASRPETSESYQRAQEILTWSKSFVSGYKPEITPYEIYNYIYEVFAVIVNPYLIKVGNKECDISSVIGQIDNAANIWRTSWHERIYDRFDLIKSDPRVKIDSKIPSNWLLYYMSDRHNLGKYTL